MNYQVELKGSTPLIMHRDHVEWADMMSLARTEIKESDRGNFSAGDDRCPAHTWKGCLYSDLEKNFIAMPSENLSSCLRRAGASITLKGKETFKRITQSGILFQGTSASFRVGGRQLTVEECEAVAGPFSAQAAAVKELGFELFVKRAVIGSAKHVRVRPKFGQWAVTAEFVVMDDRITPAILGQLWDYAGRFVGLGDWRPGSPRSPGQYGMFEARVEPIKPATRR